MHYGYDMGQIGNRQTDNNRAASGSSVRRANRQKVKAERVFCYPGLTYLRFSLSLSPRYIALSLLGPHHGCDRSCPSILCGNAEETLAVKRDVNT